jgi:hypothetical protein
VDRAERDPDSHTEVSGMLGRLRGHWNQRWVFLVDPRPFSAGARNSLHRCSHLFDRQVHRARLHPGDIKNATMNRTLSSEEQREFWAQLFAVVIRYETRKRLDSEVTLELLEDGRETETSDI